MPAADEVYRLQGGDGSESRFFQKFADGGHSRRKGGTRQGIYVCTASGKLLGSLNSNNPENVAKMLTDALLKWKSLPDSDRRISENAAFKPEHRWEDSYPADGLVLLSANRDLPADGNPGRRSGDRWNRDHVWFSREEARGWLPGDARVGQTHDVPAVIVERLARFHLVDNVRGQTLPFAASEVRGSTIKTEVLEREGATVRLRISGSTKAETTDQWLMGENIWTPRRQYPHGVRQRLLGYATYDLDKSAFSAFELVALGRRDGLTQMNARRRGPDSGSIGFVFTLAPRTAAHRVAPAFIDVYNAPWVRRPSGE